MEIEAVLPPSEIQQVLGHSNRWLHIFPDPLRKRAITMIDSGVIDVEEMVIKST